LRRSDHAVLDGRLRRAGARQRVSFLFRSGATAIAPARAERRPVGRAHCFGLPGKPGRKGPSLTSAPVVTVIQARRGSTRLPGNVLLPLGDAPVLARMLERVRTASLAGTVLVATTTDLADDEIERLCWKERVLCVRGHPTDLLDRHYQAARALGAAHVVKIPSDCPLIDPPIIARVLPFHFIRPA